MALAICKQSGHRAGQHCSDLDTIMVSSTCLPSKACPYHKIVHLDKNGKHRVHSECEHVHEMKQEVRFVLPPLVEKYYKSKHPHFQPLPPFRSDCETEEDHPLAIIYPKKGSKIFVPKTFHEVKSQTVFEATHREDNSTIFWHLDDQYLGQTTDIHQITIVPEPGKHVLTLIDQTGRSSTRKFNVVGKEMN